MKALVLSGGGNKGAYQVGVLRVLLGALRIHYDMIYGVSVGALNGAHLAQFNRGEEGLALRTLEQVWNNIRTQHVHVPWSLCGDAAGVWKPSLRDSSPLAETVNNLLSMKKVAESDKQVHVGAVNLHTGEYKLFSKSYHNFVGAVLASSSFPVMLTPIELDGHLWTDGGLRTVTPLHAAVVHGASEIDVIMCPADGIHGEFPKKPNAIAVAKRAIDIIMDQVIDDDVDRYIDKMDINIRLFRPDKPLTTNPLDFSPEVIRPMIQQGFDDARRTLNVDGHRSGAILE